MSNAKLPAPTDRCELCEETYKDHSPGDHKYCPERDVIERGQGWFFSYDPKKVFTPKAGAEATGKSDELTMNKFVDKYLTYAYSRQHTGDMWTLTLEKVWKEVIEPLLSNKKA